MRQPVTRNAARMALISVWLWTGVVSVLERHGQGVQLLQGTLIRDPSLQQAVILAGAAMDLTFGVGMAVYPRKRMFDLALAGMTLMTVIATVLSPELWLHPLGPLLKNIPIAVLLWQLRESSP
ncbi:MAG: DoxX-like family protein [Acidobacteriota bacterium]